MRTKLGKMKWILASIMAIGLSMVLIATPAMAASYNMASSCPPCSATSPIQVNPETDHFYSWQQVWVTDIGWVWDWRDLGDSLTVKIRVTLDWTYPVQVDASASTPTTLADGYEALPLEFITIEPMSQLLPENVWTPFYIKVNLPDEEQYYNKHYQVSTSYCSICTTEGSAGIGMCSGNTLYFVTPEPPEGKFVSEPEPEPAPVEKINKGKALGKLKLLASRLSRLKRK